MATRLEKFYEDAFGTPQSRGELYTGFFLMIAGILLGLGGVILFVTQLSTQSLESYTTWRKTGAILIGLSPPAILLGVSVSLPTRWTMRILDTIGITLCLIGLGIFLWLYPYHWNLGEGLEVWAVAPYALGVACILASTLSSIVGYYVARATGGGHGAGGGVDLTASEYNYDIPDSVIEKDIELAMRRYNVSWGGEGAESSSRKGIQFDVKDEFTPGTIIGGKGIARSVTLDAPQVDMATEKLRSIRGGKGTTSVDTKAVDDSTEALLRFRQRKQEIEVQRSQRGFWNGLKRLFGVKPKGNGSKASPSSAKPVAPAAQALKK